jgi:stage II sporulation protein D
MFALNCADAVRQRYLGYPECALTLAEIRKDLKLKSSYFCIVRENDQILIQGHGYGHGLGMCQEGAMEMARVGYTYVDILMFYYRKAKIIIPSDDIR